ncbi:HNH endonuclease signature motif containing protein [Serratia fonticola]|uniref:HNH endonuclease signature motif containing protein n=1 Tax=Serratia fonticola TaxID=47917 RepID=UPI0027F277C7|nr:HNH endonuclease signature motif containing protein [Serratia fonticola]MDQ7209003.1 HNH endonuclease signature motif containing protein [Serratia fonticola]HBE9079080.1 HNH endonuclease [Serratia fonticola]HBE9089569.1 HNH endonuclease [Serratia fonticola]HBE9152288.1 HNH endonuclease [Serratia fonticola]
MNWNYYFNYKDGKLYWNHSYRGPVKAGDEVKNIDGKGYIRVMVNRKFYLAHRIIYEMHNGKIPIDMQIDHIDGNRVNNVVGNLRVATASTNQRNKKKQRNNTSGVTGVCFDKNTGKWVARLFRRHLGKFSKFEDACEARRVAEYESNAFTDRHGK